MLQDDSGQFVPDFTWHERARARYQSLVDFMLGHDLIGPAVRSPVDMDRWLDSFDRSPAKSVTNHTQLERALAKIRSP